MDHLHQLFLDASTLMFAGMIFVYVFLGLLVIFINTVLAKLAIKFPDAVVPQSKAQIRLSRSVKQAKNSAQGISPSVVAAITSAVSQYRQQHSHQQSHTENSTGK